MAALKSLDSCAGGWGEWAGGSSSSSWYCWLAANKKNSLLGFAAFCEKRRIACRLLFATTSLTMSDGAHLTTWVNRETKTRFAAVARHQGLSDSALLKRLIDTML